MTRITYKYILEGYKDKQSELIDLLRISAEEELMRLWGCSRKPIKYLRKHLNVKQDVSSILFRKAEKRSKWEPILDKCLQYPECKDLLLTKPYEELASIWDCSIDVIKIVREKLGIPKRNISQTDLLKQYTKEQLEDIYINKFNCHLGKMADDMGCYVGTLSNAFDTLGIKRTTHFPLGTTFNSSGKVKAKEIIEKFGKEQLIIWFKTYSMLELSKKLNTDRHILDRYIKKELDIKHEKNKGYKTEFLKDLLNKKEEILIQYNVCRNIPKLTEWINKTYNLRARYHNIDYLLREWGEFIGDAIITDDVMDRILHLSYKF